MGFLTKILNNFATNEEEEEKQQQSTSTYRQNVNTTNKNNQSTKWYSGEKPTAIETIKKIGSIYQESPEQGTMIRKQFLNEREDPSSHYFDTYAHATNPAVSKLTEYGFAESDLQGLIEGDTSWKNYLLYNGTTTTPSAPGKNASEQEKFAYQCYLYDTKEKQTQTAETEWAGMQEELAFQAKRKDLNMSDDDIWDGINWDNYPTLRTMMSDKEKNTPTELNRGIGFSKEAAYGVMWAARQEDGGTGDHIADAFLGAMGKGTQWQYDPEINGKLEVTDREHYSPHSVSSTLYEQCLYFGMDSFSDQWVEENAYMLNSKDKTERDNYIAVAEANEITHKAEDQKANLESQIEYWTTQTNMSEAQILKQLDKLLGKSEYSTLKSMDDGMKYGGDRLVGLTRPVDYRKLDMINKIHDGVTARDEQKSTGDMINETIAEESEPAAEEKPVMEETPPEAETPEAAEETETETPETPEAEKPAEPEAEQAAPEAEAPKEETTGKLSTPTDLTEVSPADIEAAKELDTKIADTGSLVGDYMTEDQTAVWNNAGSSTHTQALDFFATVRTIGSNLSKGMVKASETVSKNYVETSMDSAYDISKYETVRDNLDELRKDYAEYEAKWGDIKYLQEEFSQEKQVTVGDDILVTLEYNNVEKRYDVKQVYAPTIGIDGMDSTLQYYLNGTGSGPEFQYREGSEMLDVIAQIKDAAAKASADAPKIQAAHELLESEGEQGKIEVEKYATLYAQIHSAESYLADNEASYNEKKQAFESDTSRIQLISTVMGWMGVDNSAIAEADATCEFLSQFYDQPQLPASSETKYQYMESIEQLSGQMYTPEQKSEFVHSGIDYCDDQINTILMMQERVEANGYKLPEKLAKHMQFALEDYQNEKQGFEYAAILTDTDPEELQAAIEAGKAFEKKYGGDEIDMKQWDGMFGYEKPVDTYYTLREKSVYKDEDNAYITKEDEDVYYYLLGKNVLQYGEEFQQLWDNVNTPGMAEKTDEMLLKILKDSNDYVDYMSNDDYGVWTSRQADNAEKRGKELVESGFWGGLAANIGATVATIPESLTSALYLIDRAVTGKRINPDSAATWTTGFKSSAREATTESIKNYFTEKYGENSLGEKLALLGYEIYCNRGDSLMNSIAYGWMFGGVGGMGGEFLGSMPMGATAALTAAAEAIENGADMEQAWLIAGVTFIMETGTEAITYSNIQEALGYGGEISSDTLKEVFMDWLTGSGLEETFGESITQVVENAASVWAERLNPDNTEYKSELRQLMDQYIADTGDTNEDNALSYALVQQGKGVLHTALVSYISPGADAFIKTGKAVANTVNVYRKATKIKQSVFGDSKSTLENMLDDWKQSKGIPVKERKTSTARTSPTQTNTTQTTTEGQTENAPAAETTEQAAPAEQAANTEQTAETETGQAAGTEAQQTGPRAPTRRREVRYAEEGLPVEASPMTTGTETTAETAAETTAEETAEAATAETAETKNEGSAIKPGRQRVRTVVSEGLGVTASPMETETATTEQTETAKDVAVIEKSMSGDNSTKTAGLATALTVSESGEQGTTVADASSAHLRSVFGDKASTMSEEVLVGAVNVGINPNEIKTAMQYAALGNGAAADVILSDAFQATTPENKARMLLAAAQQDAQNESVQAYMNAQVDDYLQTREMARLAGEGAFEEAENAQAKADQAAEAAQKADESLTTQQDVEEAAAENVERATEEFRNDPGDPAKADQVTHAVNEQKKAMEVTEEYQQSADNAHKAQEEAQQNADKIKERTVQEVSAQAKQAVAEQKQQAAERAAAEAEAKEQQAKEQAEAQAKEDEASGKAADNQARMIAETYADTMGLTGEERDTFIKRVVERHEQNLYGKVDMNGKLTNAEGYLALRALERKLNIPIEYSDQLGSARGMYKDGKIYLNKTLIQNGNMTVGQALVECCLHEITHSMENTKNYKTYKKTVLSYLCGDKNATYENNAKLRAMVDTMIANRKQTMGQTLTTEEATAEVIADFARTKLNDDEVIGRFIDNGLGGKMRNTLHNINQAMKNFFAGLKGEDRTTAEYLRRAERSFQKAINEVAASQTHPSGGQFSVAQFAQAAGLEFDADTLTLYDKNGNEITGVGDNRVTREMMNTTPVGMLIDMGLSDDTLKDAEGNVQYYTDENGNVVTDADGNPVAKTQKSEAKQMFADLMNLCARYRDNDLIWEIAGSELAETFSALKSNSDPQYKTTVDFGTICSKTQAIIDTLSGTMMKRVNEINEWNEAHPDEEPRVFEGLKREDIMMVYDETHKAGLSVPCPVCYVFSRWMGVPSLLGQMNKYQHRFVVTNEDGTINTDATSEKANAYVRETLEKYGDKEGVAKQKTSLQNKLKTQEKNRTKYEKTISGLKRELDGDALDDKTRTKKEQQLSKAEENLKKTLNRMTELDEQIGEVGAFNWVTQALCKQERKGNSVYNVTDENGNYVIDPDFVLTPEDVLFDMNKTGEFASKYAKNWKYRTTRGAGMGKAIMPYSGASIGDIINGKSVRWTSENSPFLTMNQEEAQKAFDNAKERVMKQNLVGGQRFQSTSDFRPEWGLDYVMSFLEMQALGSKVQMYTKVSESLDFLGSIGADVNASIMPESNGYHEATDEEISKLSPEEADYRVVELDGKKYVMDFSGVTGMNHTDAFQYSKKYNSVQPILVGINDTHIRLAMRNKNIDFIIPWHSSGNSKDVLQQLVRSVGESLNESDDYTDFQTDKFKSHEEGKGKNKKTIDDRTDTEKARWDARIKILTGVANKSEADGGLTVDERKMVYADTEWLGPLYERFYTEGTDPDCYGVALSKEQTEQVFPYEYWDKTSTKETADVNGQRFAAYCDSLGLVPRFSQFKDEPGYWKLLIDRKMYDNDGNYREQQVVDVTKAEIGDLPTETSAKYGPKYSAQEQDAIDQATANLAEKYDGQFSGNLEGGITDADIDQMLNQAGMDYQSAANRGDIDAMQQDLDFVRSSNSEIAAASSERLEREKAKAYQSEFAKEYDAWDKESTGKMFTVGQVPESLTSKGIPDYEVVISSDSILHSWANHNEMTDDNLLKQAPIIVNDPILAMWSPTIQDRILLFGEVDDGNGNPIMVVMESEPTYDSFNDRYFLDVVNIYAKDRNPSGYITRGVNDGRIIYADNNRIGSWASGLRLQLPSTLVNTDSTGDSVTQNGIGVNGQMSASGEGQMTDADIDQLLIKNGMEYGQQNQTTVSTDQEIEIARSIMKKYGWTDSDIDQEISQSGGNPATFVANVKENHADEFNAMLNQGQQANTPGLATAQTVMPVNNTNQNGPIAYRQFGRLTAQESDALHKKVQKHLYNNSAYTVDTNQAQVDRAVDWVISLGTEEDPTGYHAAVDAVTSPDFDYRSADGQARMITVMAMAAANGNTNIEMKIADAYNEQGTDLGRALQARKLFRLMSPIGRRMTLESMAAKINQEYKNTGRTDINVSLSEHTLEAAMAATTEEEFAKVQHAAEEELAEQMPATWQDKLRTWRMVSMLANPRTHIRNIVGNALFVPTVSLKNAIGAGLESYAGEHGMFGYALTEKTKAVKYSEDAQSFAAEDVKVMKDVLTGEAKYQPEDRIKQNQKAFGQGSGILSKTVGKTVQAVSDFNSFALEAEDWVFLNHHYQSALASYMTANNLKSSDMTGETLDKARAYAVQEAQKATYRDANSISTKLNQWSKDGGFAGFVTDAVLPFKKTPANILRRGIEYSPVGLVRSLTSAKRSLELYSAWTENGQKGNMPKGAKSLNQVIDNISAGLTGTGIAALGAFLSSIGAVKLKLNDEDDELEKLNGSQEYSVEMFGMSFTLDWAAPDCMPFFTGAALYNAISDANNGDVNFSALIDSLSQITDPVFNLSMLDGVNSLLKTNSYNGQQEIYQIGQKIIANYGSSLVPSVLGATTRTFFDRTRRKAYTESGSNVFDQTLEQIQNKIPFLSTRNIPYRNVWGEAEESTFGEALIENFISPGYFSKVSDSELTNELQRVYDQTMDKGVIPQAASKSISVNGSTVKLNDQQYDQYVVTRGQTAKALLTELIGRDEFKALTPTDVSQGNPEAQVQVIKDIWSYANQVARKEQFPESNFSANWMKDVYENGGDVIGVIFSRQEDKAKEAAATDHKADLLKSIDIQDADGCAMHLEGLKQAGKTDKSIRTTLTKHYKALYQQAVRDNDKETMDAIKYGLCYLDLGEERYTFDDIDKWAESAWD